MCSADCFDLENNTNKNNNNNNKDPNGTFLVLSAAKLPRPEDFSHRRSTMQKLVLRYTRIFLMCADWFKLFWWPLWFDHECYMNRILSNMYVTSVINGVMFKKDRCVDNSFVSLLLMGSTSQSDTNSWCDFLLKCCRFLPGQLNYSCHDTGNVVCQSPNQCLGLSIHEGITFEKFDIFFSNNLSK